MEATSKTHTELLEHAVAMKEGLD
eukprot:COSAG04_NODE_20995_length_382_cov_0.685512_2_plen_23_part_01